MTFIDSGWSGNTFDRPGMNAMRAAIEDGQIETVFVRSLSRIGRDYLKTDQFITWLQGKGIKLVSATEGDLLENRNDTMTWLLNAIASAK